MIDLNGKVEVKTLQLASLRSQLERDRQLAADGLLSQELLKKSELAVAQATIELKQLEGERENARIANRTELDGLALEMSKLRKESREARRVLELATPRADREGVLTWALTEEGVAIRKGDVIARVADLSSFRVDATVSRRPRGPARPRAARCGSAERRHARGPCRARRSPAAACASTGERGRRPAAH